MSEMTATEARADWAQVLRTARSGEPVTVTQHGEPAAVIVDVVWWRRAQRALEDAADAAAYDVAVEIEGGHGQTAPWRSVRAELKEEVTAEVLADVRRELGLT